MHELYDEKATNQSKSQEIFFLMNCKIMNKASEWMDCTSCSLMYSNIKMDISCVMVERFFYFSFLLRFRNEKWMKRTKKIKHKILGNEAEV